MDVELTDEDREIASVLAHKRNDPKIAYAVPNYRFDESHSDFDIHYVGVLAEIAVAKVLGISVDKNIDLGGDQKFDLVWKGLKIQVKYNHYSWGELYLVKGEPLVADVYVLVVGDIHKMTIKGWATRNDFAKATIKNYGYGERLALFQKQLREFAELQTTIAPLERGQKNIAEFM